ncbi:hypothetical protein HYV69_03800 [Candidatus Uhrbacteria bacterium]|nr:hypothetical protein [Candidatus Uhrbacteria bacterium]
MVLPAIAATAERFAAGAGRAVASASSKGAKISSVAQMKSQFQKNKKQQENGEQLNSALEQTTMASSPTQQFKQTMAMARRLNSSKTDAEDTEQESDHGDEQALKQAAIKKVIPRGVAFLANQIATALELSTAGTAFIFTWFIRLFSLGWLNVEMVYGRWIAKGKSKAVPPLDWAPIPMPIDKDAKILQAIVILADVFCIVLLLLVFALPIILLTALFGSISSIL